MVEVYLIFFFNVVLNSFSVRLSLLKISLKKRLENELFQLDTATFQYNIFSLSPCDNEWQKI
jgi:hypothetical protein